MTSGPAHRINPLVADVGSPPIPEAQAWTRRYDGSYGPLINLSQAVPGNAPHAELLERMAAIAGAAAGSQYGPINGDAPLKIEHIHTACGCTAAVLDSDTILPQQKTELRVTFDTTGFQGAKVKTVRVYTNDPKLSSLFRGKTTDLFLGQSDRRRRANSRS